MDSAQQGDRPCHRRIKGTAMAHPNETLLRSLYGAFSSRDLSTVRTLFADDIIFHQPGRNPTSGDYQGIDGVLGLLGALAERSGGTFRAEVHDVLASDQHAVGLLRVSAQRGPRTVDVPVVHVWHVRDGKLAEAWVHPADQSVLDEFWA
jgi:ketosteroid isomerase-like protein